MFTLRTEIEADTAVIADVTTAAFRDAPHSGGNEAAIVAALRAAGALTLSLVALNGTRIIGHIGFSPVGISDGSTGWFGLGPVSVLPAHQGQGVGSALIHAGLSRLEAAHAAGCVVLGDPGYYARFGFAPDPDLDLENVPAAYFTCRPFGFGKAKGRVTYHPAFFAA